MDGTYDTSICHEEYRAVMSVFSNLGRCSCAVTLLLTRAPLLQAVLRVVGLQA